MAVKNKSASALGRLRNQAKEEGISYQMSLQLFFQEEFLRRLSHSRYRDNLILKVARRQWRLFGNDRSGAERYVHICSY